MAICWGVLNKYQHHLGDFKFWVVGKIVLEPSPLSRKNTTYIKYKKTQIQEKSQWWNIDQGWDTTLGFSLVATHMMQYSPEKDLQSPKCLRILLLWFCMS